MTEENRTAVFELKDICFSWPGSEGQPGGGEAVFAGLSYALHEGHHVGLFGPNGCGKTTFLKLATGLLSPQSGEVRFRGEKVSTEKEFLKMRCSVGYVLQNSEDQLFFPEVIEDVAFGPLNQGLSEEEARKRATETLDSLGLSGFEHRISDRLSGGEKKLVAIASVLSMQPSALLLDEPTAGLDDEAKKRLVQVLSGIAIPRITVSHDGEFLMAVSDTFATIEKGPQGGRIVPCGRPELHTHQHAHPVAQHIHTHSVS